MPKQKKQINLNKELTVEDYLRGYDAATIAATVSSFEASPAWEMFRAFLKMKQREFEVVSLDLVRGSQTIQAAAHASGVAQGLEDVADSYIRQFKDLVLGTSPVVENARPEEELEV